MVFRARSKEAMFDPHLTTNNSPTPVKSKVKVLGVTFDSILNLIVCSRRSFAKKNVIYRVTDTPTAIKKLLIRF